MKHFIEIQPDKTFMVIFNCTGYDNSQNKSYCHCNTPLEVNQQIKTFNKKP